MSKRIFAVAALVAAVISTPVLAIPIAFDFTGVVQRRTVNDPSGFTEDLSSQGQSFTARMVIETELMTLNQVGDFGQIRQSWNSTNFLPAPSELSITIDGSPLAVPLYDLNAYAATLQDVACSGAVGCFSSDSLSFMWRSQQTPPTVGLQLASTFSFIASQSTPSYVDLSQPFDLDSLLTMALPNLTLQFGTTIFDCQGLNLCFSNTVDTTWLTATLVRRTDLSQVSSVPEPGTLGMLAMGLLGAGFARRRPRAS
jgi:hypothetical protein